MKKLLVLFSLTTSQLFAASVGYWQIPLNLNASQLTSGTVPTNVLPGALPTLSVGKMYNTGATNTPILTLDDLSGGDNITMLKLKGGTTNEVKRYIRWHDYDDSIGSALGQNAEGSLIWFQQGGVGYHPFFASHPDVGGILYLNAYGTGPVYVNQDAVQTSTGGLIVWDGTASLSSPANTNKYVEAVSGGVRTYNNRDFRAYKTDGTNYIGIGSGSYGYVLSTMLLGFGGTGAGVDFLTPGFVPYAKFRTNSTVISNAVTATAFTSTAAGFTSDSSFTGSGLILSGTNQLVAPTGLSVMGAHLWTDGTNLCVVLQNQAGARTTNKLSMTAWP